MEPWAIYAFKQTSFWYILWLHLGYLVLYTKSVNISSWYPHSLPTIFLIISGFNSVGKEDLWVLGLILFYLHTLISRKYWTQVFLDKHYSHYLVCVLNDIEGVRIPCLCTVYSNANILNYAQTLGSFLILFRALYLSYHDIFFCPIGSLIACFIR